MRHGYITLAIQWQKPRQRRYEYSLREHEAVLSSLRDATRHFSIDTDRVFLTGHGSGGDAAWDLAQSHPDLWAGVVPFVAQLHSQRKYVQHYWENAKYVSLYFVAGEKDGLKMTRNAEVLDKYFIKRFDTTVVEYLGRGHEPFYDEILQVFEWMGLPSHRRTGSPAEFSCSTMRPWDNFFWWIEGQSFPKEVYPEQWGQIKARPNTIACRIPSPNLLWAKTASARTTFWLSPDVVDFAQPIEIKLNGRKLTQQVRDQAQPDLSVLLEDVRMRADRIRPFWAKVEVP
jgi:predicted esterase